MAQVALGIVGAVIGSFIPGVGPGMGYMIGSSLGGALFGPSGPDGPRLTDLKVQSSQYGTTIPIVYNKARLAGQVIWAADLVEHEHEEDSFSGGGSSNYSYTCSFAVSICEGPKAVLRIWADGKVIYDVNAAKQHYKATSLVFYPGDEDQLPDPTILSIEGLAPAYRGQCYCVFTDLELAKFGNRIPNLTFEVGRIEQADPIMELTNTISPALGGSTYAGPEMGSVYISSTDRVWFPTGWGQAFKNYLGSGIFAILDPNDDFAVEGYTSNETGYYPTASDGGNTPPADQAALDYLLSGGGNPERNEWIMTGTAPTGVWAGKPNNLAKFYEGAWIFANPIIGTRVIDYASSWEVYHLTATGWEVLDWVDYNSNINYFYNNQPEVLLYSEATNKVFTHNLQYGISRLYDANTGICQVEKVWPEIVWTEAINMPFTPGDPMSFCLDDNGDIWFVGGGTKDDPQIAKVSGTTLDLIHQDSMGPVGGLHVAYGSVGKLLITPNARPEDDDTWYLRAFNVLLRTFSPVDSWPGSYGSTWGHVLYVPATNVFHVQKPTGTSTDPYKLQLYEGNSLTLMNSFDMGGTGQPTEGPFSYDPITETIWQSRQTFISTGPNVGFSDTQLTSYDPATYEVVRQSSNYATKGGYYPPTVMPGQVIASDPDSSSGFWRYRWGAGTVGAIVNLGEVVYDISMRTKALKPTQVDVSELTDDIKGYIIGNMMPARSAIETLSATFFFDSVESDGKVKFVKRGSSPVATIESTSVIVEETT